MEKLQVGQSALETKIYGTYTEFSRIFSAVIVQNVLMGIHL